jgi:hypothetical protein
MLLLVDFGAAASAINQQSVGIPSTLVSRLPGAMADIVVGLDLRGGI